MSIGNVLKCGELAQARVQLSKLQGVFQVLEFLQLGGKPRCHQQVYHPEVFDRIILTTKDLGGGDEISVPVNGALSGQHGIVLVNVERFPLELSEAIAESPPSPDTIECAEEDDAK